MKNPTLSICIPTYNRSNYLKRCILSALKVEYQDIEIIVSNNASQDDTLNMLNTIKDKRLRVLNNEKNLGFAKNLLKVSENARGKFILLVSDEDEINYKYIDRLITNEFTKFDDLGLIFGSNYNLDTNSFYYKFNNQQVTGIKSFKKFALSHSYMSGMILLKQCIDFKALNHYVDNEKHFFYPHEIMTLMVLKTDKICISHSDIICYMRNPLKSHIIDQDKYYHYNYRIETFEQYNKICNQLGLTSPCLKVVQNKISSQISSCLTSAKSWERVKNSNRLSEKLIFLRRAINMKGVRILMVLFYVIYNKLPSLPIK